MPQSSSTEGLVSALRATARAMAAGDQLPSTRELIARHGVSPVTVSRALALLSAEGVVVTRPGSGTYVSPRPTRRPARSDLSWQTAALGDRTVDSASVEFLLQPEAPERISLAGGYPHPVLLATRALSAALARAARRPDAAERPPLEGLSALRGWFARSVGGSVTAKDVLITSGAQAALSTAFRAIAPAGATVLLESPTYIGALAVARGARLRAMPVPVDHDGVRPDLLAEAFAATGARVFYCQPTFQNPTGSVLSVERRRAVLAIARDAGAFVIEDDFARWLAHRAAAPPPLVADDRDAHVVHIASLTKATSPNLRVGALVARGPVAERLRALRVIDDFFVPRPMQEAALELVSAPAWPRHLKTLGAALLERRNALIDALSRHVPDARLTSVPSGGLNLWLSLPDGIDEVALAGQAQTAGVLISPGRPYYAAEPPGPHIRLSFAATPGVAQLDDGARRLANALNALQTR
ncbi:MAG: PLP-dependent aminotransferase family protein [Actinomycetota bacterium]|nr:PLP-dependent aminotransferase family protein [Actinomycetota bacterium]